MGAVYSMFFWPSPSTRVLQNNRYVLLPNKGGARFPPPFSSEGSLPTDKVGQLFGWTEGQGGSHPEKQPDFSILLKPEYRFFVMEVCQGPGPNPTAAIVDFLLRRAYKVELVTTSTDDNLIASMAVDAILRQGDKIFEGNTLRVDGPTCEVMDDADFFLPVFDRNCFEKEAAYPQGLRRILVTDLVITGATSIRHYIVGRNQSIFRWIAFPSQVPTTAAEIRALAQLKSHPYIAPCEQIVLDPGCQYVIGYTSPFYHGGDLADQTSFRSKNIAQLMMTVDDLNFEFGLFHQDLHSKNIVLHNGDIRVIDLELVSSDRFPPNEIDDSLPGIVVDAADADAACVTAIAYEMCTAKSASELDHPEIRLITNRTKQQSARGDLLLAAQWMNCESIDVDPEQIKAALRIWRRKRLEQGYCWLSFMKEAKFALQDVSWLSLPKCSSQQNVLLEFNQGAISSPDANIVRL